MKKNISLTVVILIILSTTFSSCRKTDTNKLAGDWKVVSLTSSYAYKNKKYETSFDGNIKTDTYSVIDTVITVPNPTPHDSTITYTEDTTFTGEITTDYHTDGTYIYNETFKNNITGVTETIGIDGNWYFTDANHSSDYGLDDLLAMQVTKLTFNTNFGNIYSTIYQGNNTLDIYQISTLKKDKIVLKMEKAETINFILYVTTMEFTLEPR